MNTAGVDLGGTRVRVGVINEEMKIMHWEERDSEVASGSDHTLSIIISMLERAKAKFPFQRIGICAPGPLDHKLGVLLDPPNLLNWGYIPITDMLHTHFGLPVLLLNDANAAALSEASSGSGREYESVWFTTVSTGIGSGYVHQGKLIQGARGCAGEIGNMIIVPDGKVHSNMNPGALEAYASGTALTKVSREQYGWENGAREAIERAIAGEQDAIKLIDQTLTYIAIALANVVHTVNPAIFVMGGGVMTHHSYLLPILAAKTNERVYESLKNSFDFAYADHGTEAGVLGAAIYARDVAL
ncbi:ROK family protein [Jeotgalibacillus sp. S-D1]|uniref:ROK family protein n=1 Tax=Jeotgalibacillus sp. S-D1 TaxID=2552189 RepID=UPI00105967AE|nr:ROK family protein [Jeotgalibacillus sp. S-D1]TDL32698.1 ROK family protein [Jeotgalibacillus sp. S-D1]